MPIYKVEVTEYQCLKCDYRWINRVNGVEGPIPERCSKCKKLNWNQRNITHKEIGLRRRITYLKTLYRWQSVYWGFSDNYKIDWHDGLSEKFLNLDPRPTVEELNRVLRGPEIALNLNSQNQNRRRGHVPDPNKPGRTKYDAEEYKKLLKQQAQKQQELMQQIIASRPHKGI
jgi:hypothetical protein